MRAPIIKKQSHPTNPEFKSFLEHLYELRARVVVWFICFIFSALAGFALNSIIYSWLVKPLGGPLYYSSPTGGFEAVFGISIAFGFIVALPVMMFQILQFVRPTFEKFEHKTLLYTLMASIVWSLIGITVAYYLLLPPSLKFLSNFGNQNLTALITVKDYISFVTKYLLSFAIIFQIPIILLTLNEIKELNLKKLISNFKYVFLGSFIVSAILTPTSDILNQLIMAAPISLLYGLSILILKLGRRNLYA